MVDYTNFVNIGTILLEGIIFLSYMVICAGLTEFRFSKKTCLSAMGGILSCIALLQAALFLSGQDMMFLLTILPITAYLPIAAGLYVLSQYRFWQMTAVWAVGILSALTMKTLDNLFLMYYGTNISGWELEIWQIVIGLSAAALLIFLVFRFLYRPFHVYVRENRTNWQPVFFPLLMIVMLFFYFRNSSAGFTVWFLLFLTGLSLFVVIIRFLAASAAVARMKETEEEVEFRMQVQRQEYEDICKKMEAGRIYRHDMRHHLSVLEELAKQGEMESVLGYLENMEEGLSKTEKEVYCENITINAVLSSSIGSAKDAGCVVSTMIDIPEEIPYDDIDICMVLANAIENAANACRKINEKEKRYIRILAKVHGRQKLIISVENSCEGDISFDRDGYPDVPVQEGHGIGLKSIRAIADKYNGCLRCECSGGEFRLQAAMFCVQEPQALYGRKQDAFWKKFISSLSVFAILVGCASVAAQAAAKTGSVGVAVRIAEKRSMIVGWGDTVIETEYPVFAAGDVGEKEKRDKDAAVKKGSLTGNKAEKLAVSGNGNKEGRGIVSGNGNEEGRGTVSGNGNEEGAENPQSGGEEKPANANKSWKEGLLDEEKGIYHKVSENEEFTIDRPLLNDLTGDMEDGSDQVVEELNRRIDEYIDEIRSKFLWYVCRKYDGYVCADIDYKILRNDTNLLVVQFVSTINAGGSVQYSRNFVLDKKNGKILELKDLFFEGSDYCSLISKDILRQMKEQMKNGTGNYFVPGGIWPESDCFKEIDRDQDFYINRGNQLVIVFEEYEVAPGSMGTPEFVIDTGILKNILQKPSCLK